MTREEQIKKAKIDKQIAIINICYHTALAITKSLKKLPKKKPFGTKGKTPLRRAKRKQPLLEIASQAYMSAAQIGMIQMQPIPNYESANFPSGGMAIDNNNEPEYIVFPGDKGYWTPTKPTPSGKPYGMPNEPDMLTTYTLNKHELMKDTFTFSKAMQIPVITLGIITEVKDEENGIVSVFYGTNEETPDLCLLQKHIELYSEWEPHYPYDFRIYTKFGNKEWRTDTILNDNDTLAITFNVYINSECTDANRLVNGNDSNYEKVYWFCAKKK